MGTDNYQWDIIEKLSFTRPAGSDECRRACDIIRDEVRKLGGETVLEAFSFEHFKIDRAVLRVTEPYEREYEATGIGFSGNISGDFPFKYVERATKYDLPEDFDGAAMINEYNREQYGAIKNSKVAVFIAPSGKFYADRNSTDLTQSKLGRKMRDMDGEPTPGFLIRSADAIEMVKSGASRVHCELAQHSEILECENIISIIPGESRPDEYFTFSAHYDSVDVGVGAYDNATGVAALLWLYRYFTKHRPQRSLVFIWCCAEERGLLGSLDYVSRHPEINGRTKAEINFDLTGPAIGYDGVSVAAAESVCEYVRGFADGRAHSFVVNKHAASSDSTSFAEAGIPSFNFYRYGQADIHNRFDVLFPLFDKTLDKTTSFVRDFILAIDKPTIPFDTKMPDDMAEEVRKYLH